MKQLLTKHNINTYDEKGFSLLMWASIKGNKEMCETLLKEGAEVDKKNQEGQTALYAAASRGHFEVCGLLLANNANVNVQENSVPPHSLLLRRKVICPSAPCYLIKTRMSMEKHLVV